MSLRTNTSYRGRYNGPVPTSNLLNDAEDFPVFEPFEGGSGAEVAPRSYAPGQGSLSVVDGGVDMCQQVNEPNHQTAAYDTPCLVVRRGQEFLMRVTFNRQLAEGDDFQLEFLIASKGSMMVVTFGSRTGGGWAGKILDMQDTTVTLSITPTADAIVGKYRTYVAIDAGSGMQRTARDANTDLYMLFNAWCPEDAVFLPDESGRREYVLNDYGVIFQGSVGAVSSRGWMYGQFEQGILDACIYILDSSQMPIYDRGNAIKLVRKGSAMVRIQILRCLGIPSRVITNFSSAHDNTGNLKTDLIFKPDGTPDRRNTRDSIWNYHCWNEVYMVRPDLPPGLEGWQVVDATPQETSDGHFRCGPASIAAIKEGLLCHPFDSGFVFAEVNSDVVFHKRDRYGTLTPYRVEKAVIGQSICTKAVGSDAVQDITHTYKYPE
eukprot:superscaffoldBa00006615_g21721